MKSRNILDDEDEELIEKHEQLREKQKESISHLSGMGNI